ncbi:MAG TPA: metalloregulator ArsR/SmtB family transcription factor [Alloacidobacterium sp.]|nr:metalloregulator ArsR/SmtB family transcription factor [Alloacidobacterium sp.]
MNAYLQSGCEALGDATRFAIFRALVDRPQAVGELAGQFPVSRPAVSQHLRVLKHAGLVRDQKSGTRRIYAVDPEGMVRFRRELDQLWDNALLAFKEAAERWEEPHAV